MIIGEALVTLDELREATHELIQTDEEQAQARIFIMRASARVRAAGRNWNRIDCPEIAHVTAVASAARDWDNPGGYNTERADTLNIVRGDTSTEGGELTAIERRDLAGAAGRSGGFWSVRIDRGDQVSDADVS